MHMEEKIFDKELEMQREAQQFQMQTMHMMTSLVNGCSTPSSFPPPITTSTQYPPESYYMAYDDDATQI